jgi:hypothetical protein
VGFFCWWLAGVGREDAEILSAEKKKGTLLGRRIHNSAKENKIIIHAAWRLAAREE